MTLPVVGPKKDVNLYVVPRTVESGEDSEVTVYAIDEDGKPVNGLELDYTLTESSDGGEGNG